MSFSLIGDIPNFTAGEYFSFSTRSKMPQSPVDAIKNSSKGRLKYDRHWDVNDVCKMNSPSVRSHLLISFNTSLASQCEKLSQLNLSSLDTSANLDEVEETKPEPIRSRLTFESVVDEVDGKYCTERNQFELGVEQYERESHEKLERSVDAKAREIDRTMAEISEETEEAMKLVRQKYLVKILERIKSHSEECETLIGEINRRRSALQSGQEQFNSKLKEIEARHLQLAAEKEKQAMYERKSSLSSTLNRIRGNFEEHSTVIDRLEEDQHTRNYLILLRQQQSVAQSIVQKMTSILSKDGLTIDDEREFNKLHALVPPLISSISELVCQCQNRRTKTASLSAPQPETCTEIEVTNTIVSDGKEINDDYEPKAFMSFAENLKFALEIEKSLESFITDVNLKSYKNNLQQFVRTVINSLCNENVEQLLNKARQLNQLFSNKPVFFQEKRIQCDKHPDAINFCYYTAAKTFIAVGGKQVSSIVKAAFPMGALIAMLWSKHANFGRIFIGLIQEKCPYLIPYYPVKEASLSEAEYLIACGYTLLRDGKSVESEEAFVSRSKALTMIYGAVIQSNLPDSPCGLNCGWRWLASFLNLTPRPIISAALLHGFLSVAAHSLMKTYGQQFVKLIIFINNDYLPLIEKVTTGDMKRQTLVQLKLLIENYLKVVKSNQSMKEPEGIMKALPKNF